MSWNTRLSNWWAGIPNETSESVIPEGLALVRRASAIPDILLEAWWKQHWPEPDARDGSGRTPLWWAAAEGESGSVRALLALGANPRCAEHHQDTCCRLVRLPRSGSDRV